MLMLVLGDNLLLTFLGWEGVGALLLPADLVLVHRRRPTPSAGKKAFVTNRIGDWGFLVAMFLAFAAVGLAELPRPERRRLARWPTTTATAIAAAAVRRRGRQVGPVPAVRLAARRHGRPDAGVGPHPRRHHGHRRRLPDDPGQPAPGRLGSDWLPDRDRLGRRGHRAAGGHHRRRPERHQEGAGVLDGQPARLHVPGRRRRAPTSPPSSTWSPTPSSRPCCSSAPGS